MGIIFGNYLGVYAALSIVNPVLCIFGNNAKESQIAVRGNGSLYLRSNGGNVVLGIGSAYLGYVDKSLSYGEKDLVFKREHGSFCNEKGADVSELTTYSKGDANKFSVSIGLGGSSDWSLKEAIRKAANRVEVAN